MELTHQIDVADLDAAHRSALEDVIGAPLQRNQRLMISVTEVDAAPAPAPARHAQTIRGWTGVYEGLTDDEVDAIDREVRTRANLARHLP